MKKAIRYALIALGILIVIVLVLPFFVSVNSFRPTIEQKLSAALGRQVQVGNLGLSILSGSVSASDLSISDDPSFSNSSFLTAKSLKIGVELMPLIFSRTLHVTSLTIESPQVTLLHDPAGRWNFSSLGGASTSAPAPASSSSSAASSLVVEKLELKDGQLTVGSTKSSKRSVYSAVDLEIDNLSPASQFPITLKATLPGGGSLSVTGTAGPLDPTDAALTPLNAKLDIESLNLTSTGFVDPSSGLGGIVNMNCTVQSTSGTAEVNGSVNLSKLQVVKGGAPAGTPVAVSFDSTFDLQKSTGVIKQGSVTIGKAVAHLGGTYDLSGDTPAINVKISGQDMPVPDLESVLPAVGVILPKGASLQSGTLTTNLSSSGPTSALVTTGNIALANATLGGFSLGSQLSSISALSGISKATSTTISKLTSNVRNSPDGTALNQLDMVVNGIGEITGDGTIAANTDLDFKMKVSLAVAGAVGQAIGGLTGNKNMKLGIPIKIGGTTSSPTFGPDLSGATSATKGLTTPASGAASAIGGLFGKKKKSN